MSTINLKETFPTDSQSSLTDKVNFNFNQLLSLGVGQPGQIGPVGEVGPVGPIGPQGLIGPQGTLIFTDSVGSGATPPTYPAAMQNGDILITQDMIWQAVNLENGSNSWIDIVDFNKISAGNLSGVFRQLSQNSRVIKPSLTNGSDLTNSLSPTDPNYQEPGSGETYQTVLYNFNEQSTYSLKSIGGTIQFSQNSGTIQTFSPVSAVSLSNNTLHIPGHGYSTGDEIIYSTNGGVSIGGLVNNGQYFVLVVDPSYIKLYISSQAVVVDLTSVGSGGLSGLHKLIGASPDPDKIFPATSNLLIYSIYDPTATSAQEFQTGLSGKGFRGQLELGSVDSIATDYPGVTPVGTLPYLVSPSFENLKIRKYKISGSSSWSTDYTGRYFLRAEYDLSASGSTISDTYSPRRHSEQVWMINKAGTGSGDIGSVIKMKLTNSEILSFTQGASVLVDGLFLTKQTSTTTNSFGIGFDPTDDSKARVQSSSAITEIEFVNLAISLTDGTNYANAAIDSAGDLAITHLDSTKKIKLNTAIQVMGDRLAAGLPFPTSLDPINSPSPLLSSSDSNTLDEYVEVNFTPTIDFGSLSSNSYYTIQPVYGATGKMTKIGNKVTLDIRFIVHAGLTETRPNVPPYYSDPFSTYTPSASINFGTTTATIHKLGNESFGLAVRGVPNHWPDQVNGGDKIKFDVSLTNLTNSQVPVLRSWPLTYKDSTGTLTSVPWLPILPQSLYAQFEVYDPGTSVNNPQLIIRGYRKGCSVVSNLSMVDFLNPDLTLVPLKPGTAVEVSINGTYLTSHNTAQVEHPWMTTTTTTAPPAPTPPAAPTMKYAYIESAASDGSADLAIGWTLPSDISTYTSVTVYWRSTFDGVIYSKRIPTSGSAPGDISLRGPAQHIIVNKSPGDTRYGVLWLTEFEVWMDASAGGTSSSATPAITAVYIGGTFYSYGNGIGRGSLCYPLSFTVTSPLPETLEIARGTLASLDMYQWSIDGGVTFSTDETDTLVEVTGLVSGTTYQVVLKTLCHAANPSGVGSKRSWYFSAPISIVCS